MSLRWKVLLLIVLPTLVVGVYYLFMATGMYLSESRFAVRSPEGGTSSELLMVLGQVGAGMASDAYIVEDYILSPDLLNKLEQEFALADHYQNGQADFLSRLKDDPTREEFLEYYRKIVNIRFDSATGIAILTVRAFAPDYAQQLNQAILRHSEKLVNTLRDRAMKDLLSLARQEVKGAEERLSRARRQLKQFRQESDLIDPQATAGAVLNLVSQLEGQAAKARTELAELRSYMQESSSAVIALKSRVKALEEQIRRERARLTGEDSRVINEVATRYEELTVEHEFAQKQYVSALTSLESARIRAESQSRYLVDFVPPTLAEEAQWPKRIRNSAISLALFSLIFGIGSLLIAAVREHVG